MDQIFESANLSINKTICSAKILNQLSESTPADNGDIGCLSGWIESLIPSELYKRYYESRTKACYLSIDGLNETGGSEYAKHIFELDSELDIENKIAKRLSDHSPGGQYKPVVGFAGRSFDGALQHSLSDLITLKTEYALVLHMRIYRDEITGEQSLRLNAFVLTNPKISRSPGKSRLLKLVKIGTGESSGLSLVDYLEEDRKESALIQCDWPGYRYLIA